MLSQLDRELQASEANSAVKSNALCHYPQAAGCIRAPNPRPYRRDAQFRLGAATDSSCLSNTKRYRWKDCRNSEPSMKHTEEILRHTPQNFWEYRQCSQQNVHFVRPERTLRTG